MPRKKSNLNNISRAARRMRVNRSRETEEQTAARKAAMRNRMKRDGAAEIRRQESQDMPACRKSDLSKRSLRAISQWNFWKQMTEEERENRRKKSRITMAQLRSSQTEEQREKAREIKRLTMKNRRSKDQQRKNLQRNASGVDLNGAVFLYDCTNDVNGIVKLPLLTTSPELLRSLVFGTTPESQHFQANTQKYSGCIKTSSFGADSIQEPEFNPIFESNGTLEDRLFGIKREKEDSSQDNDDGICWTTKSEFIDINLENKEYTLFYDQSELEAVDPLLENKEVQNQRNGDFFESIDFILAYKLDTEQNEIMVKKRTIFEAGLANEGLILEKEKCGTIVFVKIRAPKTVVRKYCELMKLRMPMRETPEEKQKFSEAFNLVSEVKTAFRRIIRTFVTIEPRKSYQERTVLYAEYSRDKSYLFDEDSPDFFTETIRILVIEFIINRQRWTEDLSDLHGVGVEVLVSDGVYDAAYPLHDGTYTQTGSSRNQLRVDWADLRKWIRLQPIDDVKDYFGAKCAFYFAWLGFYTQLLIPASILGVIVFLYGFWTLSGDELSTDTCNKDNIVMCPLCDKTCDYWKLSETCLHAKVVHLFDNHFTVAFAFLMSVWATLFLESWKRHSAVLSHRWGLSDYSTQTEHPRPQYLAQLVGAKKTRINVATGIREPVLSLWFYKIPTVTLSYFIIIMFIMVAIIAVIGVIIFRMWMYQVDVWFNGGTRYSHLVIPSITACLNLVCIMVLNNIYDRIAVFLTSLELPRTQSEFECSLSIKLYIFQFVNYYSSIMYLAYLKGKFVGHPGKYNKIFGFRQEECIAGGCLIELSLQLAIIMIGKQVFNSVLEVVTPIGYNWLNQYSLNKNVKSVEDMELNDAKSPWAEDYKLLDWGPHGLFMEYLEVVMQFGFVTLFASAFPLAPLFALINNVFELRLDAQKILKYYRRPIPYLVPSIGVWYRILDVIGKLAVVSNATIIAFTSSFIPQFVYNYIVISDSNGYLEFSLSYFATADFPNETAPVNSSYNVSTCRYNGYREPPQSTSQYKRTVVYWQILVARLLFIIIFQNVVFMVKTGIQWLIPDVPEKLSERMKKEADLKTELLVRRETEHEKSDDSTSAVTALDISPLRKA